MTQETRNSDLNKKKTQVRRRDKSGQGQVPLGVLGTQYLSLKHELN